MFGGFVSEGLLRVRRLPENVVNKIAAGEVVERPAAVVKELIENAIDAGATRIDITLEKGGIERVIVTDNGSGMLPEDLAIAVDRHCTSKLHDEALVQIETLGFRGEALPSIGAAARLCITSRCRIADRITDEAWRIRVEGGIQTALEPTAGDYGTHIVVEDLFFATPVRRKFLKSPKVEGRHAEMVVRRLAFARPHIAFRLIVDGYELLTLPEQDLPARAAALLEIEDIDSLIPISEERQEMILSGVICPPSIHRATTNGQLMLVNGRPVIDPLLRTAVRLAYRRVIEAGRYPVVALALSVPLQSVDVNVHPAKTELRFAEESAVRSFVIGAIQRVLACGAGSISTKTFTFSSYKTPYKNRKSYSSTSADTMSNIRPFQEHNPAFKENRLFLKEKFSSPVTMSESIENKNFVTKESADTIEKPLGIAIAQILETYILAVTCDGGLIVVDQHAAHERLTHERLREQFLSGRVFAQRLLVPDVVNLSRTSVEQLLTYQVILERLGIEIEIFGKDSLLVRTLPSLLGTIESSDLLRDLVDELSGDEYTIPDEIVAIDSRLDSVIARMACHGSIRAGQRLTLEEMNALLRQMEAMPYAGTCSHGRPTWIKLTRNDLEKMFGRR
ncbi:MAG: DNA mismatch repair endonuclease MutL [Acetobacter sp.]|nr:DNA mismatch repair endonuclease MutL [Acetobacter sp.]